MEGPALVGAVLDQGRPPSDGVGDVRAEGDPAHPLGRDRLLLDVDRLAIGVVAADVDGAAGPRRVDPVAGGVAVPPEHEHVVAQGLEVIRRVIARDVAFIVERRHLPVGPLGEVAAEAARVPRRVAGDARHLRVGVGHVLLAARGDVAPLEPAAGRDPDGLGQPGFLVVVAAGRIDRVGRLDDLPGQVRLDHRILIQAAVPDLEPPPARGRPQGPEVPAVGAAGVRGRAAGHQRGLPVRRPVAVDALDLDGRADLALQTIVAVHVLDVVAIDAMHALFHVDVHQVDGHAVAVRRRGLRRSGALAVLLADGLGHLDRRHQLLGRGRLDRPALAVEHLAVAVLLEDGAEDPAVAVEVGELGVAGLRVQVGHALQEPRVGPQPPGRRLVGVGHLRLHELLGRRVLLLLRIHQLAVGLLVPPRIAHIRIHDRRAGVNMTHHALTRGDRAGEFMLDRVALLVLRDRGVGVPRQAEVTGGGIRPGVHGRAVIRVDDVAGGAAAGAIVAGVVVRAEEVERGVEQSRLGQADEHRVGAVLGAEPSLGEAALGLAGVGERVGQADLADHPPAPLERPQGVARLARLEVGQGVEEVQDALLLAFPVARRGDRLDPLGGAVHAVALAEVAGLQRVRPVVVQGRAPEHGPVGHHALAILHDFIRMAIRGPATDVGDSEVPRVDEPDELGGLVVHQRIGAHRVGGAGPGGGIPRGDVGEALVGGGGVAAVAVRAAEADGVLGVGVVRSGVAVDAPLALGGDHLGRLAGEVDPAELGRHGERLDRPGDDRSGPGAGDLGAEPRRPGADRDGRDRPEDQGEGRQGGRGAEASGGEGRRHGPETSESGPIRGARQGRRRPCRDDCRAG